MARALELADAATPLNELLDNDAFVLSVLHETEGAGQRHIELWRAVERLAKTVAGDAQLPQRRRHALLVLDALGKRPPPEIDLSPYLPDLKKAAGR